MESGGDLEGRLNLNVQYNDSGTAISRGQWALEVRHLNADGAITTAGVLSGEITGGTVTLNENGSLASLSGAQLSVREGHGNYEGAHGTGTVSLTGNAQTPNAVSGTLSLSF